MGVILKKGKEKILHQRHHWIFSGAIQSFPKDYRDGALVPILSHSHEILGAGYFNRKCSLQGRVISFGEKDPEQALLDALKGAISLRHSFFREEETNAYRLVNGEADHLPGLIIDKYKDILVLQIGTLGMEMLKEKIVQHLQEIVSPKAIFEKSNSSSRKEEGLKPVEQWLFGTPCESTTIHENGYPLLVSFEKAQKTGFFLDQREMRSLVGSLAQGKTILNCFCYTGGFTVAALKNGAAHVASVDISKDALALAEENVKLNGFSKASFHAEDVFDFLENQPLDYDLIILDPPAFAKKKEDIPHACKGYKELNRLALEKMPRGSLLLTCSCSYHLEERLFQMLLFQAANEANREVRILSKHRLGFDHPINLFHPETDYLKSFLLYVT